MQKIVQRERARLLRNDKCQSSGWARWQLSKKKKYAEEIVHYLLKHTSTKKQQKNGRGLILIYLFFHEHINVQIIVENIKLYERIVDTSSTHRFKIFHKITDF